MRHRRGIGPAISLGLLVATLAWALGGIGFFDADWGRALGNLREFGSYFFPPDFSDGGTIAASMLVTVQMAYVGTLLGAAVALPLAAAATDRLARRWVVAATRAVLAAARTIPSILWALLLIVVVGYAGGGALAGTLAIAAYTVGYLGKLYYEAFDGVDAEVLEAIRSTGAGRIGIIRHAVLPESANVLLSQLLFIFEYNVRASSILGLVGAGGIGYDIARAVETFQYDRVLAILIVLLAVVVAIDVASQRLRRRFVVLNPAANPA